MSDLKIDVCDFACVYMYLFMDDPVYKLAACYTMISI
jgi:hypothetical protein